MSILDGISVVVLFVDDLDRSRAFYGDTLGLPLRHQDPNSAFFGLGGTSLLLLTVSAARDLLPPEDVAARPAGARSQLVSFVEDVDAIYRDLSAQGVEFIRTPVDQEWGLRTAHFKDPDGHIWEIAQSIDSGSADA